MRRTIAGQQLIDVSYVTDLLWRDLKSEMWPIYRLLLCKHGPSTHRCRVMMAGSRWSQIKQIETMLPLNCKLDCKMRSSIESQINIMLCSGLI